MKASVRYSLAGALKFVVAGFIVGIFVLAARAQTASPFNLPLYFEANPDRTEFLSRDGDCEILISARGAQIALRNGADRPATARMSFDGGNARAAIGGDGKLAGKINYLIGSDSSKWETGLPTFSQVRVSEIYPGIDLVFHGNQRQLEYDFAIASGANPSAIKMRFDGAGKIFISPDGELVLKMGAGEIRQPKPEIYQNAADGRKIISGGYKILDARTVAFDIGSYDHSLPLVIDPLLSFSSYFGLNLGTTAWAIARDNANDFTYIAGQTFSKKFFTEGAFQTNFAGGSLAGDAFVAKFGDPATNLIYLTYLGGSGDDAAFAIAVDSSSHAFITGATQSPNFPTNNPIPGFGNITGKIDPNVNSFPTDIFVSELSADGSSLVYSTYFGGSAGDGAYGIALDSADNAYITGFTYSKDFPIFPDSASVLQDHLACSNNVYLNANAFVAEIPSGGNANPVYSSYLGGTNFDTGRSIAVDADNNVYVAGYTKSFNFPVVHAPASLFTNFPAITNLNGTTDRSRTEFDAFVTKFPPLSTHPSSISSLVYSTFLGGTNGDQANGIAVDSNENAYVTGWTTSPNFPNTGFPAGLFSVVSTNQNSSPGATNVFLTKISSDGSQILDSTVFGGNRGDIGYGVALNSAGDAFVVGSSSSTNFPTVNGFDTLRQTNSGGIDVFVTNIKADWSAAYYSVLIGGKRADKGYGIALDSANNAYITGSTISTNFPTSNATPFAFDMTNIVVVTNKFGTNFVVSTNTIITTNLINDTNLINGAKFMGTNDAFLAEILFTTPGPTNITLAPTSETIGVGGTATFALTVSGISTPVLYQWQREKFTNVITLESNSVGVVTNKVTNSVPSGIYTNLLDSGRISGATSNILTITNAVADDGNGSPSNYQAVITWGDAPYITNATLEVQQAPVIVDPPEDQTNFFGGAATFTVITQGQPPLHYQWLFNGTNLANSANVSGATNNTLTITGLTTNNAGTFEVVITNAFGSTNASANLAVNVTSPTNITLVPTDEIVGVGGTARFALTVTGSSTPVFYQWQRFQKFSTNVVPGISTNIVPIYTNLLNSGRISGATSSVLTIANVTTADGDGSPSNYQAVITWGDAPYITNATLEVEQSPVIAVPPVNQANVFGGTATFTVTAFGTAPLHYQWLFDGTPLANSTNVSGATSSTLTITGLTTNNAGTFEVVITNAFGSTNASANLTINVTSPTNITLVPINEVVGVGGTARFALTVTGTSTPVFYQWQREKFTNVITLESNSVGVVTNKVTNSVPTGIYTNLLNSGRISGATSSVLTIANVTTADGDGSPSNYQAILTWGEAPYITNATLAVEQAPVIAVPPVNQTNVFGGTATFTVTAFGTAPLHYQWLFDGTPLANSANVSGATSNTLTITSLTTNNAGTFEVVITNAFGSTNASANLTINVTSPTNITLVPIYEVVGVGGTARFTLTATGTSTPVFYQWQRELFTNIITTNIIVGVSTNNVTNSVPTGIYTNLLNSGRFSGVTSNVLTITNVTTADGDGSPSNYQAILTWGEAPYITNATLLVEQSPVIAVPPVNQTNALGASATFIVTAFGTAPLYYQWLFDGTNLANSANVSGATNNTLTITGLTTNNEGTFEVVITNAFGSTNASATLTLIKAPFIVTPLTNQVVGLGASVNFVVEAVGETPLHYSWTFNGATLADSTNINGTFTNVISGTTNSILALSSVSTNDSGTYEVTITNDFGATNSSATLSVLTAPMLSVGLDSGFATNKLVDFTVVGGTNSGWYSLLFTNNLLAPPANWPRVGPAQFGSQGQFSFSLDFDTNYAQQFYMLQLTNSPF